MTIRQKMWQRVLDGRLGRSLAVLGAAALLSACSLLSLAYNRLPTVVYWHVDGLVDLSSAQSAWLQPRIDALHSWHRRQQLPAVAQALRQWQAQANGPLSSAVVCQALEQGRGWVDEVWQQALPDLARLARELSPAQLDHLARHYAKADDTFRSDWMGQDAAERRLKRWADRASMFYGSLTPEQQRWLAERLARAPWDAARFLAERQRRQADTLVTLRAVAAGSPAEPALQALADRVRQSPDTGYRAYAQAMMADTCAMVSELHARTTPDQRARAVQRLAAYAADLDGLAGLR